VRPLAPIAITGYSVCNALGSSREAVLAALGAGRTGLAPARIPLPFDTAVGAVNDPLPDLPQPLSPWSTRVARMAAHLVAGLEPALRRARARWRPERIAVIMGTSTGGAEATEQAYRVYVERGALPADYDFRRQHTYGAVLHVVGTLAGARGPAWMISTACTSSAKPLASAQRLIATGAFDAAIVGGIDTLCAMTLQGFHALGALDAAPCRPFAKDRAGVSIGEGGALLLVERDGDARALLESVGESSDAYHISAPHPEGRGARDAMERALAQAGVRPSDIDHINAHGTGTRLNDVAEAIAIAGVLGPDVPVVSTKGYTGHTLGGAGATEVVMALLALEEGWIPASLGAEPIDERVAVNIVTTRTTGRFRRVLSNSFVFGGNNVSVLVRTA
jgi:3-oxoacyl-[acyl-carrier-protein] synthase-1